MRYDCRNKNVFSDRQNPEYANLPFVSLQANCSTLLWPQLQRSCPRRSWRFGGQSLSSCQQNAVALLERLWQAYSHHQGIPGQYRTRTGGRASLLEHHALPHRLPVQPTKHWWNVVGSLSARYQSGSSVLYGLQATEQFVRDAKKQSITIVQATGNESLD